MINHLFIKSIVVGLLTFGAIILDEHTAIPVVASVVIASAWGRALWWLGRKFQSLEDGLKVALDERADAKKVMADLVEKVNALKRR